MSAGLRFIVFAERVLLFVLLLVDDLELETERIEHLCESLDRRIGIATLDSLDHTNTDAGHLCQSVLSRSQTLSSLCESHFLFPYFAI